MKGAEKQCDLRKTREFQIHVFQARTLDIFSGPSLNSLSDAVGTEFLVPLEEVECHYFLNGLRSTGAKIAYQNNIQTTFTDK